MLFHETARDDSTGERWRGKTGTWCSMVIMLVLMMALVSCSSLALFKPDETGKAQGAAVQERAPRPGDTKVVDGVEFEFVRNVLFATVPAQPEYVWEKKVRYGN